jgi:hypothetical protein
MRLLTIIVIAVATGLFATACSTREPPATKTVYVTVTEAAPVTEATEAPTVEEPAPAEHGKTFGDGVWIMPDEMPFGTYRAPGGNNCYYEVLRNFSGNLSGIITNDVSVKNPIVTISSNAAGFSTDGCGEWTRIGGNQ